MTNYHHDQSKYSYLKKTCIHSYNEQILLHKRFRISSNASQADLLSRTHPVRLSGTVIASSAILPYMYVEYFFFRLFSLEIYI